MLERLLGTAWDGPGAVLVVHGDPGVGKTALLEYAVELGQDLRVVRTVGVEGEKRLDYAALQQLCSPIFRVQRPSPGYAARRTRRRGRAQRRALAAARYSSASQFSSSCPVQPRSSPCCASSTTPSGSTTPRLERSGSWHAACRRRGSRSRSRRCELGDGFARFPQLRESVGSPGFTGIAGVRPRRAGLDEAVLERIIAETGGNPLALIELPRGSTPAQLAGGFGLPAALPLCTGIEQSFVRRLSRLPHDRGSTAPGGRGARRRPCALRARPAAAAWDPGDSGARRGPRKAC